MHYIAERRRPDTHTLFVIDEFGALRMGEDASVLFEQVRSFGGSLVIAAQGYSALGPPEYARRILDSCSTYILHACSDPLPIIERAGKTLRLDTSWSEDEEGVARKHTRVTWDWKVPVNAVLQQEVGQAFWIYRGRAQHVQTAQVALTQDQIHQAWQEIRRQEAEGRRLQTRKEPEAEPAPAGKSGTVPTQVPRPRAKKKSQQPTMTDSVAKVETVPSAPVQAAPSALPEPMIPPAPPTPTPDRALPDSDDDEPDRL